MNSTKCPYCEKEVDITYDDHDGQESFDKECPHCGREFEVEVDYEPIFHSSEIIHRNCKECGKEFRYNGWTFPIPKKYKNIPMDKYTQLSICKECYRKLIFEDYQNKYVED